MAGELGDLVGLGVHFALGHGAVFGDVVNGQEMDLAAVGADGAAGGLAIGGGLREQAGHGGFPGRGSGPALLPLVPGHLREHVRRGGRHGLQEAVQRLVERIRVDLPEDTPEGPGTGRPDVSGQRVRPAAQDQQRLACAPGRPLRNRGRRVVPGRGECAYCQAQHEVQRMPAAQPRTRVRDQGKPLTQAAARRITSGKDSRRPRAGTSIREDRVTGTALSGIGLGWHLRSWETVPACQTRHRQPDATLSPHNTSTHHTGLNLQLAGAVRIK